MKKILNSTPWDFLKRYKGIYFNGEWPTLPEMFAISAKRFSARPCLTDFEGFGNLKNTIIYAQAERKILQLAAWLNGNGIKKGDRVALTGKNSPEWTVVFFASLFAGAVAVPIDWGLREAEVENLLNVAKPKFFFVDEEKYSYFKDREDRLAKGDSSKLNQDEKSDNQNRSENESKNSDNQNYNESENSDNLNHNENGICKVYSLSPKFSEKYVYNLSSLDAGALEMPEEDDLAVILFTSGTTGNPKGVMLTHKNLISDCYIAQTRMKITEKDVFYALLPIHHAYTMQAVMIEALSVGAEIVYGKSMAVSRLMKELKEGKITMLLGVPLLFNKLLAGIMKGIKAKGSLVNFIVHLMLAISYVSKKVFKKNIGKKLFKGVLEQANIYSLRIAICGGGPLAESVFKIYNQMGIDFVQGYGLTETSPILTLNPIEHFKIQSVGQYFFPHMQMKILNPSSDGVGEVAVKGPMVFKGYYNLPDETKKSFTGDGFFRTGDLGRLDKEGYLILSGRAKNLIVTDGGKNVYPEEIENAFQLESDIAQITVQGYVKEKNSKAEEIEALIYVSDELYKSLGIAREENFQNELVKAKIGEDVAKVNKTLRPYERISKITILEKPLEMTTTQKVKRNYGK